MKIFLSDLPRRVLNGVIDYRYCVKLRFTRLDLIESTDSDIYRETEALLISQFDLNEEEAKRVILYGYSEVLLFFFVEYIEAKRFYESKVKALRDKDIFNFAMEDNESILYNL